MGKKFKKKIFGAGISLIILSTIILNTPVEANKTTIKIIFDVGGNIRGETEIPYSSAVKIFERINEIDNAIKTSNNSSEIEKLFREKLKILRESNILPPEFTLENISSLATEMGKGLSAESKTIGIQPGLPYVSMGPSVFVTLNPFGTIKPIGVSPDGFIGSKIVNITKTYIKMNISGIYVHSKGPYPFIRDQEWKTDNPLWQAIWKIINNKRGNTTYTNITEMHLMGFYYAEIIIGHTVSFGFAWPGFPDYTKSRPIIGSFWYFGAFTFPISFTVYQTWPQPWTVLLDFGIVPSLFASVIIPFWIPE